LSRPYGVTDMITGYGRSAAGLNRFKNRRMPSCKGTAGSRSIAIGIIGIEVRVCIEPVFLYRRRQIRDSDRGPVGPLVRVLTSVPTEIEIDCGTGDSRSLVGAQVERQRCNFLGL
jgi:hypothetical protein